MGSPAYFGKLATFISAQRKNALVPFGLFNAQDNLAFIASIPTAPTLASASQAYASTLAIDISAADVITVTLTGNVASMTLNYAGSSTIPSGQRVWIRLVQDSTGGRTVVLPSNLLADQDYAIDPGINRASVLPIFYDTSLGKWKFFTDPFSVPIG